MSRLIGLIGLTVLTACGDFPMAGETTSGRTEYPELLPLEGIIGDPAPTDEEAQEEDALLLERAEALQARAERLRQTTY